MTTFVVKFFFFDWKYGTLHEFACHSCAGAMLISIISILLFVQLKQACFTVNFNLERVVVKYLIIVYGYSKIVLIVYGTISISCEYIRVFK